MDEQIYWLNKNSRKFLERGYLLEGETAEQRINDIAHSAETLLEHPGFAEKFISYMHAGFYSLSSPIWSNFGRERGLPISCFGSYIDDSLSEIAGYKLGEIAMMTKCGGGTSGYFGQVRPRGAPISSGGHSTGSVHFMELYDKVMGVVSQGNVRRGSFAAYLPIDHGDIEEFLKIQSEGNSIQDMSIAVTVSDQWMREMIEGDTKKRKIWGLVIKKRFESGYPYIFWTDNVNNGAPNVYREQQMKIHASNLCLVGETKIEVSVNSNGDDATTMELEEFNNMFNFGIWKDIYVRSYDGENTVWSKVTASAQTGEATELIEIESENGNIIRCTPDHQILTKNRGWVAAKDLTETDELIVE